MSISRLPGPFGAEICSFDPMALSAADRDELNQALGDHAVLVARGLQLSPAQHVELTRAFGVPDIHPIESIRLAGVPEIIELKVDVAGRLAPDDPTGDDIVGHIPWHSDLTYTAEPSRGSLLYALEVPPEGGDTGFIDTAQVYDALPSELRRRIAGLDVVHSFARTDEQVKAAVKAGATPLRSTPDFEEVVHPLVHRHPLSGRQVLNISPTFARAIVGMSPDDSHELLAELQTFATQERFAYFHHWQVGDLVIWDNWRTMHTATGHKKRYRRHMLRTTVRGGRLQA